MVFVVGLTLKAILHIQDAAERLLQLPNDQILPSTSTSIASGGILRSGAGVTCHSRLEQASTFFTVLCSSR